MPRASGAKAKAGHNKELPVVAASLVGAHKICRPIVGASLVGAHKICRPIVGASLVGATIDGKYDEN
ncbi:MAG: hypothetical protein OXU27_14045 [Candidatus Poribacteria bacterium]|nr:hypothetical protein [Candidatus Poribacteria bacterium]